MFCLHILWQYHRHTHGERAVGVGEDSIVGYLLCASGEIIIVIVYPAQPPPRSLATDLIGYLRISHRHTAVSLCHALDGNGVASLVGKVRLLKCHLVCRTLIFLHAETYVCIIRKYGEVAVALTFGNDKVSRCHTILIGCHLFLVYHLVVRIAQF